MDSNTKIRATLDCTPGFAQAPEFYRIIKGASAYLTYNVSNKSFSASKIEQLTFIFKQNKELTSYEMFDYLALSQDTEAKKDKTYYDVSEIDQETKQCKATKIEWDGDEENQFNPSEEGYYEVVELKNNEDLPYVIDDHFSVKASGDKIFVLFYLSSEETKNLKTVDMQFEVAVRVDTDENDYLSNNDSVIIERQPPIIVEDSLYSHIK